MKNSWAAQIDRYFTDNRDALLLLTVARASKTRTPLQTGFQPANSVLQCSRYSLYEDDAKCGIARMARSRRWRGINTYRWREKMKHKVFNRKHLGKRLKRRWEDIIERNLSGKRIVSMWKRLSDQLQSNSRPVHDSGTECRSSKLREFMATYWFNGQVLNNFLHSAAC
jgi:hypothetical protein